MSKDDTYSIIVMYTFHEKNKGERDSFREALDKKFKIEQLDESTYAIIDFKKSLPKIKDELINLCKDINFDKGEFVSMYYACALLGPQILKEHKHKIQRVQIGGYNL